MSKKTALVFWMFFLPILIEFLSKKQLSYIFLEMKYIAVSIVALCLIIFFLIIHLFYLIFNIFTSDFTIKKLIYFTLVFISVIGLYFALKMTTKFYSRYFKKRLKSLILTQYFFLLFGFKMLNI